MAKNFLLLMSLLILLGCAPTIGSTLVKTYNPKTENFEMVKYADYYEGQETLLEGTIKGIGTVYLRKGDAFGQNIELNIYLHNMTERNEVIKVEIVQFENTAPDVLNQEFILIPDSVERITLKKSKRDVPEKTLKILIVFVKNNQRSSREIILHRLKFDDYLTATKKPLMY